MRKPQVFLFALVALFTLPTAAASLVVSDNNKLTTHFQNTPVLAGLKALSAETGIKFLLDDKLAGTLRRNVRSVPRDASVRRLLQGYSYAVFYIPGVDEQPRISHVKVFRKGAESSARYQVLDEGAVTAIVDANNLSGNAAKGVLSVTPLGEAENSATPVDSKVALRGGQAVQASGTKPGNAYSAVQKAQSELSLLQRKKIGVEHHIYSLISKAKSELSAAAGSGNSSSAPETITKIQGLEAQLAMEQQSIAQQILAKQQELHETQIALSLYKTPAEQQQQYSNRQRAQGASGEARESQF